MEDTAKPTIPPTDPKAHVFTAQPEELERRLEIEGIFPGFVETFYGIICQMVSRNIVCFLGNHPAVQRIDDTRTALGRKIVANINAQPLEVTLVEVKEDSPPFIYNDNGLYL